MTIPAELRIGRCLRTDILKARYPEVADIPLASHVRWDRARRSDYDGFGFHRQRRQLQLRRVHQLFVRNAWMFNIPRAAPRVAHHLLTGRNFMFNEHLVALLGWLATYFPHGGEH